MLQSHYQVQFIESILFENLGKEAILKDFQFLYCGNFNLAAKVVTASGKYFIKWNQGAHEGMFESEAKSMEIIRETNTLHVPKVYGFGKKPDGAYLMLDFVTEAKRKPDFWQQFGRQVAALHQFKNNSHGLYFNNYVGALAQNNSFTENGLQFFIENRLMPQVNLAVENNKITKEIAFKFEKIYKEIPSILPNEMASLIHGDLWSGNIMVGNDGYATVVDPSAYYGLREAELAFTTLFGAFDKQFYEAYHEASPIMKGFEKRLDLYNLYPIMIHLNLFGGGYLESVNKILDNYQ